MSNLSAILRQLAAKQDLSIAEMRSAMQSIMSGAATPAQIGAFLMGLHIKGETVTEIATAVKVVREFALPINLSMPHLVDIVGTGGDQSHTFNISTTSAFVAAAAGAKVAKHHNRSISSQSGSADLLTLAGFPLDLTPTATIACIEKIGIGFMFAPYYHPAWQQVSAPRRELGIRTLFNILGPLANPAGVKQQLIGVFAKRWLIPVAEVLAELGSEHVLVVHSADGLDEISIAAPTHVAELHHGNIDSYTIVPEEFNITNAPLRTIQINNPQESLNLVQQVLANQAGPARDIVALNAGAAIYAADVTTSLADGITMAKEMLANGAAKAKFVELLNFSQQLQTK
ncbi:MAG: anthranilate phosphoribosyltransferase [Coxiellaceae bacterium]|nr:MAG: anthranilate phosphoribosyltransferase [Coxiellaceae bacterium]